MNTALMSAGRSAQPSLLHSSRSLTDREDQLSLGILNFFFLFFFFLGKRGITSDVHKDVIRSRQQTERERASGSWCFFSPVDHLVREKGTGKIIIMTIIITFNSLFSLTVCLLAVAGCFSYLSSPSVC